MIQHYGDKPKGYGFSILVDFPSLFDTFGQMTYLQWSQTESSKAFGVELKKVISFLTLGVGFIAPLKEAGAKELVLQMEAKI